MEPFFWLCYLFQYKMCHGNPNNVGKESKKKIISCVNVKLLLGPAETIRALIFYSVSNFDKKE